MIESELWGLFHETLINLTTSFEPQVEHITGNFESPSSMSREPTARTFQILHRASMTSLNLRVNAMILDHVSLLIAYF